MWSDVLPERAEGGAQGARAVAGGGRRAGGPRAAARARAPGPAARARWAAQEGSHVSTITFLINWL